MRCKRMVNRGMFPPEVCGRNSVRVDDEPIRRQGGRVGHLHRCSAGHLEYVWVKPAARLGTKAAE